MGAKIVSCCKHKRKQKVRMSPIVLKAQARNIWISQSQARNVKMPLSKSCKSKSSQLHEASVREGKVRILALAISFWKYLWGSLNVAENVFSDELEFAEVLRFMMITWILMGRSLADPPKSSPVGPTVASLKSECGSKCGPARRKGWIKWSSCYLVLKQGDDTLYEFKTELVRWQSWIMIILGCFIMWM